MSEQLDPSSPDERREGQSSNDNPIVISWPPLSYWFKIGLLLIAAVVVLLLVLRLQPILLVVVASFVLAFGLQPPIDWLMNRGLARGWALTVVLGVGLLVVAAVFMAVIPTAMRQIDNAVAALPALIDELQQGGGLMGEIADRFDPETIFAETDGTQAFTTIGSAFGAAVNVLTVLTLTPYFAYAFPRIKVFLLRLIERDDRPDALYLVNESVKRISGFVAGNLLVSVVAFVASFTAFRLMGLDYALALALWVAFTDLIPVLGAALGSILVLVVAATQSTGLVIGSLVFLVLYQQFENYVVVPRVMKQTVDLSPAVVIVAFLAGGSLAGIIGALLALPITAVLKLVVMEMIVEPRMRRMRAGTGSGPTPSARRNRSPRL